jgi:hypothetical protein
MVINVLGIHIAGFSVGRSAVTRVASDHIR